MLTEIDHTQIDTQTRPST